MLTLLVLEELWSLMVCRFKQNEIFSADIFALITKTQFLLLFI